MHSIQHKVARFILQLSSSTAKVAGYMKAGFKPVKDRVKKRIALYLWEMMRKKRLQILTNVFNAVIGARDERMVGDLVAELGVDLIDGPKSRLQKSLTIVALAGVLEQKQQLVSLNCMPNPKVWFKL